MMRPEQETVGLLSEHTAGKEFPGVSNVLGIDAGSTNWKTFYWKKGDSMCLPDASGGDTSKFRNFHFQKLPRIEPFTGLPPFKVVNGNVLEDVVERVREMESMNGLADLYVLTGFSNSLAVTYEDGGKSPKTRILLDEPSARTELTPRQYAAIWHTMPDKKLFAREGLKITSSLMKLAFLQNHPEVIKKWFGEGVNWSDLKFSTMRGLLTKMLITRRDPTNRVPYIVPAGGDDRSFAGGNSGNKDNISVKVLLRSFGVGERQLDLLPSQMIMHALPQGGEIRIFNVQDFEANLWLTDKLIKRGQLPAHADFIEVDSVVKIARRIQTPTLKGLKFHGYMEYTSQRMGATALNSTGLDVANQDGYLGGSWDGWDYYAFLKGLFQEYKDKPSNRFFYYPDSGMNGTIIDTAGDTVKVVDPWTNLTSAGYNHYDLKQMMLAVLCGMAFGIKEKQQYVRNRRKEDGFPASYVYGGLVNYNEHALEIIAQCLDGKVSLLQMPYAGQAAFLQAMDTLGIKDADYYEVGVRQIKPKRKREDEYRLWVENRDRFPSPVAGINSASIIYQGIRPQ